MELHAVALVLLAALLHATWNAFVKSSGDRLVTMGVLNATRFGVCLVLVPFLPLPAPSSWFFLVLSAILHVGYYLFLLLAYRVGDLSHVYPLARGASPLLIVVGAWVFAGEKLDPATLGGVLLICAGIAALGGSGYRNATALAYAMLTALFIAAYSVTDGLGVRASEAVISYVVWLSVLDGFPMVCLAAMRRRRRFIQAVRENALTATLGGVLQLLAYGLVLWAVSFSPMAGVSALRETSVVFAALIGTLVLKERFGAIRIAAAALVAVGILAMDLL